MSQFEMQKSDVGVSARSSFMQRRPEEPGNALEELFGLLEEYGPAWYTEEHHNRAVHALLQMKCGGQSASRCA